MKILFILNDPPYGSERSYNGLRLADNLLATADAPDLVIFLMGDAVACAKRGQKTPNGYYNIERMLKPLVRKGTVMLCGGCTDARGLGEDEILEGCERSTMDELTKLSLEADKVLVF